MSSVVMILPHCGVNLSTVGLPQPSGVPTRRNSVVSWRMATGLSFVLVLASAFLPWMSLPYFGSKSLVDALQNGVLTAAPVDTFSSLLVASSWLLVLGLLLLLVGTFSSVQIGGIGAGLDMISGLVWAVGFEMLKEEAIKQSSQNGLFGLLSRGFVSAAQTGSGPYVAIFGGVVGVFAVYLERLRANPSPSPAHVPAPTPTPAPVVTSKCG